LEDATEYFSETAADHEALVREDETTGDGLRAWPDISPTHRADYEAFRKRYREEATGLSEYPGEFREIYTS